jgi:hypothetical protein
MMRHIHFLILAGAVLLGAGCGDSEDATGRLRVQLADGPFAFGILDSAMVTIDRVEVHVVGAGESDGDASGWEVVSTEERRLDLLDLTNGVTATLVDTEVPVGRLTQIRLHVVEAAVHLTDGRVFDLDIPSGDQSGIKIFPDPDIEVLSALTTELLLDFDVSRSFHPIPASAERAEEISEFFFRPSVRCANLSETGTLSGRVFDDAGTPGVATDDTAIEGAAVVAYRDGIEAATTATAADGRYALPGLLPGEYTLAASASGFVAGERTATVVVANDVGGNDFRLAASAGLAAPPPGGGGPRHTVLAPEDLAP